jgi:hypothetical protein
MKQDLSRRPAMPALPALVAAAGERAGGRSGSSQRNPARLRSRCSPGARSMSQGLRVPPVPSSAAARRGSQVCTDSPLEQEGFEPSVPRLGKLIFAPRARSDPRPSRVQTSGNRLCSTRSDSC